VPGASFAEVLEEALSRPVTEARGATSALPFPVQPPHPLLFFRIAAPSDTPLEIARLSSAAPTRQSVQTQQARLLTRDERRAFETLIALGATLTPDFTVHELRRQYRLLARTLHPDRHPMAPPDERMRLARAFAAATDSYRLLATIATAH
jgi:hypothetical protein